MEYYALKGDIVTCMAGHKIYVIRENMPFPSVHTVNRSESGLQPVQIDTTPRCPECHTPYARWTTTANLELHFSDGWRDFNGPNRKPRSVQITQGQFNHGRMDTRIVRRIG